MKLVNERAADLKHDYLTLENQLENVVNEAISITSIADSSAKLTRIGELNNLYLYLANGEHFTLPQRIYTHGRSS